MSKINREKFETWYLENWGHTEDNHETLFERSPDDEYGYYRLGVRMSHQAWQAGNKASESQLTALTSQLESVVAENAALNRFIKDDCWIWDDKSEESFDAADCMPETPATDAFIAEVRAEGMEMAACALDDVLYDLAQKLRQEAAK